MADHPLILVYAALAAIIAAVVAAIATRVRRGRPSAPPGWCRERATMYAVSPRSASWAAANGRSRSGRGPCRRR